MLTAAFGEGRYDLARFVRAFRATSRLYSIKNLGEAQAYLDHPVLGPRLYECAEAVMRNRDRPATEIFGFPDDLKLRSCATLFACALPPRPAYPDRVTDE